MNTPPGFPNPSFPPGPPTGPPPSGPFAAPAAGPPPGVFGTSSPTPSWMPQDQPSSSNGGRNVALAVMAVIALGGAGLVAYLVTSSNDDARSVAPATTFTLPTVPPLDSLPVIPVITLPPTEEPTTVPATVVVETTVAPPPTVAVVEPANLFTGTQAADVIAQIGVARGAAPLRILQAIIYPGYAFAQVQDPSIPANVDEYQWRDTLSSPAPVSLMGDGDLEANLFSDTDVNWAAIPALVEAALAQIPIEGAEVTHVFVQRNLPFTDTVQIRVFVSGTRSSGYLDADAQGNILAVNQG